MKKMTLLACLLLFASFAFAEDAVEEKPQTDSTEMKQPEQKTGPAEEKKLAEIPFKKTKSGVEYFDLTEGTGKECKMGSRVDCHYTLWFADEKGEKKTRFQSSKDAGKSFQCTLGQQVVQGWTDGMIGMKEGGTRIIRFPAELGWGASGGGPIPPNTTSIFEIEFLRLIQ